MRPCISFVYCSNHDSVLEFHPGITRSRMSLPPPSRKPLDPSQQPTLADVRERVLADEGLSRRRRQDVSSALRTVAKALARPLDEVPAHPGYLRERLERFTPA